MKRKMLLTVMVGALLVFMALGINLVSLRQNEIAEVVFDVKSYFGEAGESDKGTRQEIRIYFDAEAGSCPEKVRKVERGERIGDLPLAFRTGYSFVGWFYYDKGKKIQVSKESVVGKTQDFTLYAAYSPKTTTVFFDYCSYWKRPAVNLKGANREETTFFYDEKKPRLPTPQREGYEFLGWSEEYVYDEKFGAVNGAAEGMINDDIWRINKDFVTLYAVWKPVAVRITYDFNYEYTERIPLEREEIINEDENDR